MQRFVRVGLLFFLTLLIPCIAAQTTALMHEGGLVESGRPASGQYEMLFALYDSATNATVASSVLTNSAVQVDAGVFRVALDFGPTPWTGQERWLEVAVRPHGSPASFVVLRPRERILSVPYAIHAREAGSLTSLLPGSQITGTIPANAIAVGSVTGEMLANGTVSSDNLQDGSVNALKLQTETAPFKLFTLATPTQGSVLNFGSALATVGADRLLVKATQGTFLYDRTGNLLTTYAHPDGPAFAGGIGVLGNRHVILGGLKSVWIAETNGRVVLTITNRNPSVNQHFGASVAGLGTDRVLIGAPGFHRLGEGVGAVFLYAASGNLLLALTNPAPSLGMEFGSVVASFGNDRFLVGSRVQSSAAFLYRTNGQLLATFRNSGSGSSFGHSIASNGKDRILIGNPAAGTEGVAHLFSTNGNLLATYKNPSVEFPYFGGSVAIGSPDRVVVGAGSRSLLTPYIGVVHVFDISGKYLATITNPTPTFELSAGFQRQREDAFGTAIIPFGPDEILISAPLGGRPPGSRGAVHSFRLDRYIPSFAGDGVLPGSVTSVGLANGAVTPGKLDASIAIWEASRSNAFRATGNVGVGTTNPIAALHLRSPSDTALLLESGNGVQWQMRANNSSPVQSGSFQIMNRTAGEKPSISINPNGWIGIGTTNPTVPLTVNGNIGWGRSQLLTNHGGSIKLGHYTTAVGTITPGATPFLDFHYGVTNRLQEYNVRMINDADGNLSIIGNLNVKGTISQASDRNAKRDFAEVNPRETLKRIAELPIRTWAYTNEAAVRHIGPTAQDFHETFQFGSDQTRIATVDADGVAFSAIQGLHQELREKETEIGQLKARLEELERLMKSVLSRLE